MNPTQTFLLGVASGVAATLVIMLLRGLLGQLFGMMQGLFTRSVRGGWGTKFWKGGKAFEEVAKVNQFLHWVWGTI